MGSRQPGPQLLLESRRNRAPAAGQCSDHDAVGWIQIREYPACDVA
jgi:hypothetical protein